MVKNVTTVDWKINKDASIGYQADYTFNKNKLLENEQGVKFTYRAAKNVSLAPRVYYDVKSKKLGASGAITIRF